MNMRMKKYLVWTIVFLFAAGPMARAQMRFGLKTGVNMANVSLTGPVGDNLALSNLTGFTAGPMIEATIPIIGLGLDAAVLYSQQGFKTKIDNVGETFKLNTLEVPVNLKWKLTLLKVIGVYGAVGPYLQFKLSENLVDQFEAKSFGTGMNLGVGAELLNHLQIGVNYQLGFTEDYRIPVHGTVEKAKTATWSVTAAYLF
jgi:hypothetical protein